MSNDDEERRRRSEAARQAAMRERIDRQKERDRQIAIDIANVDKKATNRIVFESSDDEDEKEEENGNEEEVAEKTKKKSKSSEKVKLFGSDEEDDDDEEENNMVIKNRHTGPKGEKLMKMESRFNSDPRFKLDDKFVESDSDDEDEDENDKEKMESKQEKEKNRELLSKVLGKSLGDDKKPKKIVDSLVARPFTRFDPENPEHVEWMKAFEESKQKKSKKKDVEEGEVETKEEKNDEENKKDDEEKAEDDENDSDDDNFQKSEMFAHLDDKFSNELKEITANGTSSGGSNGFSFLAMMGRRKDDDEENDEEEETETSTTKVSFDQASASNGAASSSSKKFEAPVLKSAVRTKRFFIDSNDEQVRSMAGNFRRTQSLQKVIDSWTPYRDAIFKLWKKQRRDVMKVEKEKYTFGQKKRKRQNDETEQVDTLNFL